MAQRSYRFRTPGARGGGIQGSDGAGAESGVRVVQLPGCVAMGKLAVAGSKKALAEVECVATGDYRGGYGQRPFASAVLQVESSRPAAAGPRQQARGELWRLTLLQALAPTAAAAAAAGLKLDVSYNGRGLRLVVSGYAQKLPQFLLFALRRALRHTPPAAGSIEWIAARRVSLIAPLARSPGARAVRDELAIATPEEVQAEVLQLWRSVSGTQLLLAGALDAQTAEGLASAVRREVQPLMLQPGAPEARPARLKREAEPAASLEEELQGWDRLLYKASWSPLPLAANMCLDPAISATVDQCGRM